MKVKATDHDYQGAVSGNYYSNDPNYTYPSWAEFKAVWAGIRDGDDISTYGNYDDTYNFLFRYDINDRGENGFELELCFLLQRKGIYSHIFVENIVDEDMPEINEWLKGRKEYLMALWEDI